MQSKTLHSSEYPFCGESKTNAVNFFLASFPWALFFPKTYSSYPDLNSYSNSFSTEYGADFMGKVFFALRFPLPEKVRAKKF